MNVTLTKTMRIGSVSYSENRTLTAKSGITREVTLAAAKTGNLTTRTSDTVGTLTMDAGHGITTGAKIAIFWAGGCRRNVTVGTVSVNDVPFSLGSGDILPADESEITAMVETTVEFRLDGDDVVALFAQCVSPFLLWLSGDDDAEDFAITAPYSGQVYDWNNASGITNPIATDVITKARVAHGDSTAQRTVFFGAAIN